MITELDLFKVFQQYASSSRGTKELYDKYLHKDICTMTKLLRWSKQRQREENAAKERTGECEQTDPLMRERSEQFRHVITNDPNYAYHKRMLFQTQAGSPALKKITEFKRNKDPWVQRLINQESTFRQHVYRGCKEEDRSSESEIDEDYNFFKDSVYHEHRSQEYQQRHARRQARVAALKQEQQKVSISTACGQNYMMHRPALALKNMSENQKMKSTVYSKNALPLKHQNERLSRFMTIYCEQIRNKVSCASVMKYGNLDKKETKYAEQTDPVIDNQLFEKIRFQDGMPRFLVVLFGTLVGDKQAVLDAFKLLRQTPAQRLKIKREYNSKKLQEPQLDMIPPLLEYPQESDLSDASETSEKEKRQI